MGDNLPAERVDAIAEKLHSYTGLSVQFLKEANLRVTQPRFRKELMRTDREILGRYDGRFEGTDIDAASDLPGYDPSSTGITGAFVASFHDYLTKELKYTTNETYFRMGRISIKRGINLTALWARGRRRPTSNAPSLCRW